MSCQAWFAKLPVQYQSQMHHQMYQNRLQVDVIDLLNHHCTNLGLSFVVDLCVWMVVESHTNCL